KYARTPAGDLHKTGEVWPARRPIRLAAGLVDQAGRRYRETRDVDASGAPLYVALTDVSVVEPAAELPYAVKPSQKWILVRIGEGTLVAYEGLSPVYATLVS